MVCLIWLLQWWLLCLLGICCVVAVRCQMANDKCRVWVRWRQTATAQVDDGSAAALQSKLKTHTAPLELK